MDTERVTECSASCFAKILISIESFMIWSQRRTTGPGVCNTHNSIPNCTCATRTRPMLKVATDGLDDNGNKTASVSIALLARLPAAMIWGRWLFCMCFLHRHELVQMLCVAVLDHVVVACTIMKY